MDALFELDHHHAVRRTLQACLKEGAVIEHAKIIGRIDTITVVEADIGTATTGPTRRRYLVKPGEVLELPD